MEMSQNGIDSLKSLEGYRSKPYMCSGKHWTIGWGHLIFGQLRWHQLTEDGITKAQAEELLRDDLDFSVKRVNKYVKRELTQNQFDAIVSFTFNVGPGALKRSVLLKRINSGDFEGVPSQMRRWNKSGGRVLKGLKRRRGTEIELWNKK